MSCVEFGVEGAVSWGWLPGKPSGREALRWRLEGAGVESGARMGSKQKVTPKTKS